MSIEYPGHEDCRIVEVIYAIITVPVEGWERDDDEINASGWGTVKDWEYDDHHAYRCVDCDVGLDSCPEWDDTEEEDLE